MNNENVFADWHTLYITDKTGKEFFVCTASPMSTMSEIRNLQRHLANARAFPHMYKMLDVETAVVMLDGTPYSAPSELDTDAMLKELGL